MDEVKLTIRLSTEDRRALKLHAVAQGRSIQDLLIELIHTELARNAPPPEKMSREEFVASLYARRGIDPNDPQHKAIENRARAGVEGTRNSSKAGGGRGAA